MRLNRRDWLRMMLAGAVAGEATEDRRFVGHGPGGFASLDHGR